MPTTDDELMLGDEDAVARADRRAERSHARGPEPGAGRRGALLVLALALVAAVGIVGGWAVQTGTVSWSALSGGEDGAESSPAPAPERAVRGVDLSDPFDGTPAESYAESVAGIDVLWEGHRINEATSLIVNEDSPGRPSFVGG